MTGMSQDGFPNWLPGRVRKFARSWGRQVGEQAKTWMVTCMIVVQLANRNCFDKGREAPIQKDRKNEGNCRCIRP